MKFVELRGHVRTSKDCAGAINGEAEYAWANANIAGCVACAGLSAGVCGGTRNAAMPNAWCGQVAQGPVQIKGISCRGRRGKRAGFGLPNVRGLQDGDRIIHDARSTTRSRAAISVLVAPLSLPSFTPISRWMRSASLRPGCRSPRDNWLA